MGWKHRGGLALALLGVQNLSASGPAWPLGSGGRCTWHLGATASDAAAKAGAPCRPFRRTQGPSRVRACGTDGKVLPDRHRLRLPCLVCPLGRVKPEPSRPARPQSRARSAIAAGAPAPTVRVGAASFRPGPGERQGLSAWEPWAPSTFFRRWLRNRPPRLCSQHRRRRPLRPWTDGRVQSKKRQDWWSRQGRSGCRQEVPCWRLVLSHSEPGMLEKSVRESSRRRPGCVRQQRRAGADQEPGAEPPETELGRGPRRPGCWSRCHLRLAG